MTVKDWRERANEGFDPEYDAIEGETTASVVGVIEGLPGAFVFPALRKQKTTTLVQEIQFGQGQAPASPSCVPGCEDCAAGFVKMDVLPHPEEDKQTDRAAVLEWMKEEGSYDWVTTSEIREAFPQIANISATMGALREQDLVVFGDKRGTYRLDEDRQIEPPSPAQENPTPAAQENPTPTAQENPTQPEQISFVDWLNVGVVYGFIEKEAAKNLLWDRVIPWP